MRSFLLFFMCFIFLGASAYLIIATFSGTGHDVRPAKADDRKLSRILVTQDALLPGAIVSIKQLSWKMVQQTSSLTQSGWPEELLQEKDLYLVASRSFDVGERVRKRDLIRLSDPGYLTRAVRSGYRAITLHLPDTDNPVSALVPGRQIDLIVSLMLKHNSGDNQADQQFTMRDIRILARQSPLEGQALERGKETDDLYVVEVPEQLAPYLLQAKKNGRFVALLKSEQGQFKDRHENNSQRQALKAFLDRRNEPSVSTSSLRKVYIQRAGEISVLERVADAPLGEKQ